MINILNVVSVYFSIPFFFGDQLSYFSKKGYEMHIICSPNPNLRKYAMKQNAHYGEIAITRKISPIYDLKAIFLLCKYIHNNKIDIIVGHTPKGALISMIAARLMRVKKRIYFRHGLIYVTKTGVSRFLLKEIERFISSCATEIVCVSPSLAQLSISESLNPINKQHLIGAGTCGGIDSLIKFNPSLIDPIKVNSLANFLNIDNGDFVIGYCGRLVRDKGIRELVDAFLLLLNDQINVKLLLVGGFDERDELPRESKEIIINHPKIIYTGFVPNDLIENYYSLMNIFILPSYREGFGMSVLEASSMKIPILTTKSTGCIDSIIDNITGNYIEIKPLSIYKGILKLMKNPELRKIYGENGRSRVLNNYDNSILWPEIEKMYKYKI